MFRKLQDNIDRYRARRIIRRGLFDGIDLNAMDAIAKAHAQERFIKYFNRDRYWVRNAARLFPLKLQGPPLRSVFDIGCGFGYFLYAARECGHKVYGLDMPHPVLDAVTDHFGIAKTHHAITAFEPMPELDAGPFDLITAFETRFNLPQDEPAWEAPQWAWFLNDLTRFMAPRCELYFKLNQGDRNAKRPVSDELYRFFLEIGGRFSGRAVRFADGRDAAERAKPLAGNR